MKRMTWILEEEDRGARLIPRDTVERETGMNMKLGNL